MSEDPQLSKRSSKAWAISDRSGMRFHMNEMIKEPGTGYLVHYSESDGIWNMVDHPQANLHKWAELSGDPYPVLKVRPDQPWAKDNSGGPDEVTVMDGGLPVKLDLGK